MMLAAALRDLQWRRRRFLIAAIGTALVFAMTLVLTGLSHGFDVEARDTVDDFGVDAWIVREGAPGPFLGASPVDAEIATDVATAPGVESASAFVFGRKSVDESGSLEDVNVFGADPGGPGVPEPSEGRAPAEEGEIMISSALGGALGEDIVIAGFSYEIVGRIDDSTALAGVPNVFLTLPDAQAVVFSAAPIASAIMTTGTPERIPDGLELADEAAALDDMLRPLEQPRSSITFVAVLLWIVAALIIGSVVYLSALERVRDFAVFKAVGIPTRSILVGLAAQSAILAFVASLFGIAVGLVLAPVFPMKVVIPTSALVFLPVLAIAVGVLASAVGIRRVMTVDPALAFGGP